MHKVSAVMSLSVGGSLSRGVITYIQWPFSTSWVVLIVRIMWLFIVYPTFIGVSRRDVLGGYTGGIIIAKVVWILASI